MSNLTIITPKSKDLGGFTVRRALPDIQKRAVGPFVFFDHMGPTVFPAGKGIDVRPHPHIGLATVTFLFEGEFRHQDSLGTDQMIYPGDVNWMIAGKGITHSERTSPQTRAAAHPMHGLQVWVALPQAQEQTGPDFQHVPAAGLPKWHQDGVTFTLVIGDWGRISTPLTVFSPMHYMIIDAESNTSHTLEPAPNGHESGLYVISGQIVLNGEILDEGSLVLLPENEKISLETREKNAKLARIGGVNLGHRHLWWNFVATDKSLIDAAKTAYTDGRIPLPPLDNEEWIPLPQ